jgi:hypothetical protein
MENYIKKVEINCDMGEGFGKWKMVIPNQKKKKKRERERKERKGRNTHSFCFHVGTG